MRIFADKTYDRIEIYLTKDQAEDFAFRINDMANNPLNKIDEFLDDVISGDSNENNFELNSIEICKYSKENLVHFMDERVKLIILFDK